MQREDAKTAKMQQIEDAIVMAVEQTLQQFRSKYPDETIYGFALVASHVGDHVLGAIATEERLEICAKSYRYKLDLELKKQWLRWANPDDGWFQETFDCFQPVCETLSTAIASGLLMEFDERIFDVMSQALKRVSADGTVGPNVILGITHGEDPENFVYWSSRINNDQLHQRLEQEYKLSQDIESTFEI